MHNFKKIIGQIRETAAAGDKYITELFSRELCYPSIPNPFNDNSNKLPTLIFSPETNAKTFLWGKQGGTSTLVLFYPS